jgi:hypothetical protein
MQEIVGVYLQTILDKISIKIKGDKINILYDTIPSCFYLIQNEYTGLLLTDDKHRKNNGNRR